MIILYIVISIVLFIVGGWFADKYMTGESSESIVTLCFGSAIALVSALFIILFIALISYGCSLDRVSQMENFYDRNYAVEKLAVEQYANAVEVKTSENTVTTITIAKDFVTDVMEYNKNLTWYRNYQHNWFYSFFITDIPDRLNYLELPKLSTPLPQDAGAK